MAFFSDCSSIHIQFVQKPLVMSVSEIAAVTNFHSELLPPPPKKPYVHFWDLRGQSC